MSVSPLINPLMAGTLFTVIVIDFAADEPQELFDVTVIFPPDFPDVVMIESEAELPDQPDGKVQV
jgi:hypothetical protein